MSGERVAENPGKVKERVQADKSKRQRKRADANSA